MNNTNEVFKTLTLITQIGISIMTPIFILVFVGVVIKNKFNIDLIIISIVLGVIVGIRNAYMLIIGYLKSKSNNKIESELIKKHKNYISNNK